MPRIGGLPAVTQPSACPRAVTIEASQDITGDNSATGNPTINVAVPGGMAAGVYSATITPTLSR